MVTVRSVLQWSYLASKGAPVFHHLPTNQVPHIFSQCLSELATLSASDSEKIKHKAVSQHQFFPAIT